MPGTDTSLNPKRRQAGAPIAALRLDRATADSSPVPGWGRRRTPKFPLDRFVRCLPVCVQGHTGTHRTSDAVRGRG